MGPLVEEILQSILHPGTSSFKCQSAALTCFLESDPTWAHSGIYVQRTIIFLQLKKKEIIKYIDHVHFMAWWDADALNGVTKNYVFQTIN